MTSGGRSCNTAEETLEWILAIQDFIKPYRFLMEAHVVNFFKDRLWEAVDREWMDCLRDEPVESLLQIPSGVVQDHWPSSLKEFVSTLRSLSLSREQANLQEAFQGLNVALLNDVIAQGMNWKKKHEVETLAAVISSISKRVGANTVVDVGSGQGYLAQVLCFENNLSVIAIDASSHHGRITDARAKRIKKYYTAKIRRTCPVKELKIPKTVTCQVMSSEKLKNISSLVSIDDSAICVEERVDSELFSPSSTNDKCSLILTGLHACGDLSVTMLRTFIECNEVKAVISVGCCYNLLSEEETCEEDRLCGFPMSKGARSASLFLGKNARDLACQSPERWKGLGEAAGLHNFELHAFRAAFQMVLLQYFPEVLIQSPTIGRQGKTLRRQYHQRILESNSGSTMANDTCVDEPSLYMEPGSADRYSMFVKFCQSGLDRLGLDSFHNLELSKLWKEAEEFSRLIGPYWTLRAALGPVLETAILLDRLLFLQEQGNIVETVMLPIFNPLISPRNMAFIAIKT